MDEDAQPIEKPIIESVKVTYHNVTEKELPETTVNFTIFCRDYYISLIDFIIYFHSILLIS